MYNDTEMEVYFDTYCRQCKYKDRNENQDPCDECLAYSFNINTHKPINFTGESKPQIYGSYKTIKPIKNFLYEVEYEDLDYNYANSYFEQNADIPKFGCSSVRKGNWYGRNLDWFYNNDAEFIVKVPRAVNRYASIGVAGGLSKLTDSFVNSGEFDAAYKLLPFRMYDGINEHGVFANVNVVPTDKGYTTGSIPNIATKTSVSGLMLIRYILDRFNDATTAVSHIMNYVSVFFNKPLWDYGYECHYMIGDLTNTYILEFVDNKAVVVWDSHPYMTNFHLHNVRLNSDNTVYTPATQDSNRDAIITNNITPFGSGLERYNLIANRYSQINDKDDMRNLMDDLLYSKAYSTYEHPSNPYWFTEFVGERNLTCASPANLYSEVVQIAGQQYLNRSRNIGDTWHTVHSSVYDVQNKKLYLITQEDGHELTFNLK